MSAINRGQEVSLSDSYMYVLLLQDTIKETRGYARSLPREQIRKMK